MNIYGAGEYTLPLCVFYCFTTAKGTKHLLRICEISKNLAK